MISSEIYDVIDAMWKDVGTTSDHNDNWVFSNISTDVRSRLSDGTKIDVSNATLTANVLLMMGTTNQYQNYIPNDYVLEFDILEVDTSIIRIKSIARDTSTGHNYLSIDLNQYTAPYTVKVVFNKDFCDFYVDNNLVNHNTYSDSQYNRPYFEIINGNYGKFLKYANMRIYPI